MPYPSQNRRLAICAALAATWMSFGAARAAEYELVYHAILNEGGAPLSSFRMEPLAPGTPLTITAEFNTASADQWNTGAYIYTALSPITFLIGAPAARYEDEAGLFILLSDPSWATLGGPSPYSAGFFSVYPSAGAINSVFADSTAAFQAADPSPTLFYDYQYSFSFTGGPLRVSLSEGPLTIYGASVSDVTATILALPELSTWGLLLIGFTGLAGAAQARRRLLAPPAAG
jgi:hypothetical protein